MIGFPPKPWDVWCSIFVSNYFSSSCVLSLKQRLSKEELKITDTKSKRLWMSQLWQKNSLHVTSTGYYKERNVRKLRIKTWAIEKKFRFKQNFHFHIIDNSVQSSSYINIIPHITWNFSQGYNLCTVVWIKLKPQNTYTDLQKIF